MEKTYPLIKIATLFHLTKQQKTTIRALTETPQLSSTLQRKLSLPRNTLDRQLMSLHSRRLIKRQRMTTHRSGWKLAAVKEVEQHYDILLLKPKPIVTEQSVTVVRGKEKLIQMGIRALSSHRKTRAYVIQSGHAWALWATFPQKLFGRLDNLFIDNEIIVEGLFPENLTKDKAAWDTITKSYQGRMVVAHTLPGEYFDFNSDIFIFDDAVYITNWADEFAIEIRNLDVVRLFRSVFLMAQNIGKRFHIR